MIDLSAVMPFFQQDEGSGEKLYGAAKVTVTYRHPLIPTDLTTPTTRLVEISSRGVTMIGSTAITGGDISTLNPDSFNINEQNPFAAIGDSGKIIMAGDRKFPFDVNPDTGVGTSIGSLSNFGLSQFTSRPSSFFKYADNFYLATTIITAGTDIRGSEIYPFNATTGRASTKLALPDAFDDEFIDIGGYQGFNSTTYLIGDGTTLATLDLSTPTTSVPVEIGALHDFGSGTAADSTSRIRDAKCLTTYNGKLHTIGRRTGDATTVRRLYRIDDTDTRPRSQGSSIMLVSCVEVLTLPTQISAGVAVNSWSPLLATL